MPTTIPTINPYTGEVAVPGQPQATFTFNMQNQLTYEANLAPELNATVTAINTVAGEVESLRDDTQSIKDAAVLETESIKDEAETASAASQAAANFQGEWSTATGAYSKGASFSHNNFIWRLLVDVADITATEPSGASSDWLVTNDASVIAYNGGTVADELGSNDRQVELTGLESITTITQDDIDAGFDIYPLIGKGIRVKGVGLWVVPSFLGDGSALPNPATLDALPSSANVTVNGGDAAILLTGTTDCRKVGYDDPLSPPYLQTVSDIINGVPVSVLRFINPALHQDIINGVYVGNLTSSIQDADNAIRMGGTLTFTRGLYRFTGVDKSQYTSWVGETNNNYTAVNGPSLTLGTKFMPFSDGDMITTENDGTGDPEFSGQVDWFKDFAVYGGLDTNDFDNTYFFRQIGQRLSGAGFKRLDIKQIFGGIDLASMSFLNFDEIFITGKFCLNTNNVSDSVFNRMEVGTGLPTNPAYLAKLNSGYGWRCIGVPGQTNGNNRIDNCRFQLNAPGGAYSALFQNMLSTRFMSPIIDQNRTNGIQLKDCIDTEIYAPQAFNNAEDNATPKWSIHAKGCDTLKILGGRMFNKPVANLNNDPGDGLNIENDCTNVSLSNLDFDDTLVTKISGIVNVDFISNCVGLNDAVELIPVNGWANSVGSPLTVKRESRSIRITGTISGGTVTNGTLIATISQTAYRPTIDIFDDVYVVGRTRPNAVTVTTSGEISIVGDDWENNGFVAFNLSIDLR